MALVIEPLKEKNKLYDYIVATNATRVLLFFWHGLGDLIMFMKPFDKLKEMLPNVQFDLGVVRGIGQEEVYKDAIGFTTDRDLDKENYDIVAKIHFPMSEGQEEYTKGEWCCIHELGIRPVCGHTIKDCPTPNRLIAVHYNITCLPGSCNPDEKTSMAIWNEILEAGLIPLECHFEHTFHNPINKKFDFVDCTVRRVRPRVSTLAGLIVNSGAFIGVVSGNFHVAMSVLPHDRVCLLEKDFTAPMFTKSKIKRVNIKDYKNGEIKEWLTQIF
jgi:hypothetical protein